MSRKENRPRNPFLLLVLPVLIAGAAPSFNGTGGGAAQLPVAPTTHSDQDEVLAELDRASPSIQTFQARFRLQTELPGTSGEEGKGYTYEGRIAVDRGITSISRDVLPGLTELQLLYDGVTALSYSTFTNMAQHLRWSSLDKDHGDFARVWRPFLVFLNPQQELQRLPELAVDTAYRRGHESFIAVRSNPDQALELSMRDPGREPFWGPKPDIEYLFAADTRIPIEGSTVQYAATKGPSGGVLVVRKSRVVFSGLVEAKGGPVPSKITYESVDPESGAQQRHVVLELLDIEINTALPTGALAPSWPDDTLFYDAEAYTGTDLNPPPGGAVPTSFDSFIASSCVAFRKFVADDGAETNALVFGLIPGPAVTRHIARARSLEGHVGAGHRLYEQVIAETERRLQTAPPQQRAELESLLARYYADYGYAIALNAGPGLPMHLRAARYLEIKLITLRTPAAMARVAARAAEEYSAVGDQEAAQSILERTAGPVAADSQASQWLDAARIRISRRLPADNSDGPLPTYLAAAGCGGGGGGGGGGGDGGDIPADADCWHTPCGGTTYSFCDNPIPAGFFGMGSESFVGACTFAGAEGGTSDTQINRLAEMNFDDEGTNYPVSLTTPIEVLELNLESCSPILVDIPVAGVMTPTFWDVAVSQSSAQVAAGAMTVTKEHENGGVFEAEFNILPVFTFTRVDNPTDVRVLDFSAEGLPPILFATDDEASWVHVATAMQTTCSEDNFNPGVLEDPRDPTIQCCVETCHDGPAPGHEHCTLPPDCTPCPDGACCLATAADPDHCEIVEATETQPPDQVCQAMGGEFMGFGTTCEDLDVDGIPDVFERGNCCAFPSYCMTGTHPYNGDTDGDGCSDGQEFYGDPPTDPCDPCDYAAACVTNPCPDPTGACCDRATVTCEDGVLLNDCQGPQMEWSHGVLCADLDPACAPPPTGACCLGDESCLIATEQDCTTQSGIYQGDEGSCTPNPCTEPTGACSLTKTIDFDGQDAACSFLEAVHLTDDYAGLGVLFEGPGGSDGGAILNECASFGITGQSSPNFLAFNEAAELNGGGVPRGPETIHFDPPVSNVFLRAARGIIAPSGAITMTAYDANGVQLDSASASLTTGMQQIAVSASAIDHVVVSSPVLVFVVDDLTFPACSERTMSECAAMGGGYDGDGTTCPN